MSILRDIAFHNLKLRRRICELEGINLDLQRQILEINIVRNNEIDEIKRMFEGTKDN